MSAIGRKQPFLQRFSYPAGFDQRLKSQNSSVSKCSNHSSICGEYCFSALRNRLVIRALSFLTVAGIHYTCQHLCATACLPPPRSRDTNN